MARQGPHNQQGCQHKSTINLADVGYSLLQQRHSATAGMPFFHLDTFGEYAGTGTHQNDFLGNG